MAQITLYLDETTRALVEQAARARGCSKSRWVSELIHQHTSQAWPPACLNLAGRFADFPLRGDDHDTPAPDLPRLDF